MDSGLKISVNGKQFDASLGDNAINIGGSDKKVELLNTPDKDIYTFSVNNKIYLVSTTPGDDGILKIHHDGNLYEIETKSAKEALLEKYMAGSGSGADKNKMIKSPMPGMVVKIECAIGDDIQKGDKPIVLEAMKMENALASPGAGKVKAINVKEGQAVEKNTVLIELE